MESSTSVNESGDNQENVISRIFSLLSLTVNELKLLNKKTVESNTIIRQMLRYVTLFDEVAKLKISINFNLKTLTSQMELFIDIHNKLHGYGQELESIVDELNAKIATTSASKIPRRILKSDEKRDSVKIIDLTRNNGKNEERKKALETVRTICKQLGNFQEFENEKEFLGKMYDEQKGKIKNILPVLQIHMKFYNDLSKKLDDFQKFMNEATEEVNANSNLESLLKESADTISQTSNTDSESKLKTLERQRTQVLRRKIEKNSRPITSTVSESRRTDSNVLHQPRRPSTQNCRRNWIKVFPPADDYLCKRSAPVSPVKTDRSSLKKKWSKENADEMKKKFSKEVCILKKVSEENGDSTCDSSETDTNVKTKVTNDKSTNLNAKFDDALIRRKRRVPIEKNVPVVETKVKINSPKYYKSRPPITV